MTALKLIHGYEPPGPVASAFLDDVTSEVRFLRGPVAGGKTVACVFDCIQNAERMPVCTDGWIHFRIAVIGSVYAQLEKNLYPTWFYWLPRDGGDWTQGETVGGGGRHMVQTLKFVIVRDGRKVPVKFQAVFGAIGDTSVEQFMRGFEPTAWYIYECDQQPDGIIENATGRLGRYPNADMLPDRDSFRSYVIGDLNAPDVDSWYYRLVEETRPPGIKEYVQPSGLSASAENLKNLKKDYYQNLWEKNKHRKRWSRRFILNEYGPSDEGEPCFPEWSDHIHFSQTELSALPDLPILIGLDQGLRAAAVIAQRTSQGQMRIIGEVVPGRMGPRRFASLLVQKLAQIAPNNAIGGAWADPAGWYGADAEGGEVAWAEAVSLELGYPIQSAETSELSLRFQAVKDELTTLIDGTTPSLLVSSACPMLRKAMASHYRFQKQRTGNEERYADKPFKDGQGYDDVADALQFLLIGEQGRHVVVSGKRGLTRAGSRASASRRGRSGVSNSYVSSRF